MMGMSNRNRVHMEKKAKNTEVFKKPYFHIARYFYLVGCVAYRQYMYFVFDIHVYFKLFLHIFTHVNVSGQSVLLFNKLMIMMMMMMMMTQQYHIILC